MAHAQTDGRRRIADVTPIVEADAAHAGTFVRAALHVRLPDGLHVNSDRPRDPALVPLTVTATPPDGVALVGLSFPTPSDLQQRDAPEPLSVFERSFLIGARLRLGPDIRPGELRLPVRIRYQACDETRCYLPATVEATWVWSVVPAGTPVGPIRSELFRDMAFATTVDDTAGSRIAGEKPSPSSSMPVSSPMGLLDNFTVAGTDGGYLRAAEFTAFVRRAERGAPASRPFEGRGPMAVLLLVLLGGLALNFTPCVLPMIPANLAIIGAGAHAASRARGLVLGTVYGAAMAIVYGVLGLLVILTAGTFGTVNASPWFNATIAVLFFVLALSMFDLFFIDLSRYSTRFHLQGSRGSAVLAFGMGAVAALLAGACVAPVVIQVVVFATERYASGVHAALALPFVLGLGMALPWPIAGAGLAALPRPGVWMVRVKQAFGVAILLMAAYYARTAYGLFADRAVDPAAVSSSVEAMLGEGWLASLSEGLALANRDRKPVLIDLWATWCKNCLAMDRTTLADSGVRETIAHYVKIKFQAEDPDDPTVREVMRRFGIVGLPAYVILTPRTRTTLR